MGLENITSMMIVWGLFQLRPRQWRSVRPWQYCSLRTPQIKINNSVKLRALEAAATEL